MNWQQAVAAMRAGDHVGRVSELSKKSTVRGANPEADGLDALPIYVRGQEPCFLMHVWTDEDRSAKAYMGSGSRTPFVPEYEHIAAEDWVIVDPTTWEAQEEIC